MNDEAENREAERALARRAKSLFDNSVEALDGETRSRLNRGRQAALAAIGSRRPAWTTLAPLSGAAAAAVVAALVIGRAPDFNSLEAPGSASDLEILLDEDSLEMLEELEFYSWMELDGAGQPTVPENHVG